MLHDEKFHIFEIVTFVINQSLQQLHFRTIPLFR